MMSSQVPITLRSFGPQIYGTASVLSLVWQLAPSIGTQGQIAKDTIAQPQLLLCLRGSYTGIRSLTRRWRWYPGSLVGLSKFGKEVKLSFCRRYRTAGA